MMKGPLALSSGFSLASEADRRAKVMPHHEAEERKSKKTGSKYLGNINSNWKF